MNNEKTSYEVWKGRPKTVNYFKIFGSTCYIRRDEDLGNFDAREDEGIFLGYSTRSKAYNCYNKRLYKIIESANVKIDEGKQYKDVAKSNLDMQNVCKEDEDAKEDEDSKEDENEEQRQGNSSTPSKASSKTPSKESFKNPSKSFQRNHLEDLVIGELETKVQTRRRLANTT